MGKAKKVIKSHDITMLNIDKGLIRYLSILMIVDI